jgi:hypothetical protein
MIAPDCDRGVLSAMPSVPKSVTFVKESQIWAERPQVLGRD